MIFSSVQFLIFFSIFLILLKIFKNNQRTLIILFSLFFYGFWDPIFIFLIFYYLISSFIFIKKRINLKFSILSTLIPLFYFKYSFFLTNLLGFNFLKTLSYTGDLPLAISFITFTVIAILIDVKTKKYEETISFFSLSEFLVYFPQLIAGPILRAKELIPKLKNKIIFSNSNIKFGILLFIVGFTKKIFFADNIAEMIDPIFDEQSLTSNEDYVKGFLLFPLQIYFDFSGYIDMALGVSKILNIDLPINFNKPYLSGSLTDFWRNWHITLSKWFKDYVYIPLGGSKFGNKKLLSNLLITMSVAGLWHGANMNFILWGFLNGFFLFLEKKLTNVLNLNKYFKIFLTCFLVFNLWIIFRITDLNFLFHFYGNLYLNFLTIFTIENLFILFLVFLTVLSQKFDNYEFIEKSSKKITLLTLIPIFMIIILTGLAMKAGTSDKFIYFDF